MEYHFILKETVNNGKYLKIHVGKVRVRWAASSTWKLLGILPNAAV